MNKVYAIALFIFGCLVTTSHGHGRLIQPPSRASMFRFGYDTPPNYNDNELFCGGFSTQVANGYKCGVCGDNWADPQPRDHEGGGFYATGTIVGFYQQSQTIPITVQITASHLGWFEFRICPHNSPTTPVTQECLDQYLLQDGDGETRFYGVDEPTEYEYELELPSGVTCTQCVLQWKYHTGNSWGTDENGSGLGYGEQEEFYGCADITIIGLSSGESTTREASTTDAEQSSTTTTNAPTTTTTNAPTTTTTASTNTTTNAPTTPRTSAPTTTTAASANTTTNAPTTTTTNANTTTRAASTTTSTESTTTSATASNTTSSTSTTSTTSASSTTTSETTPSTSSTSTPASTTTSSNGDGICYGAGAYIDVPGIDDWCVVNCAREHCPESHCECSGTTQSRQTTSITSASSTTTSETTPSTSSTSAPASTTTSSNGDGICYGTGSYIDVPGIDDWCVVNCARNYCPQSHCECTDNAQSRQIRSVNTRQDDVNSPLGTAQWMRKIGIERANDWCRKRCMGEDVHSKCDQRCVSVTF